jgi:hypothetical protein
MLPDWIKGGATATLFLHCNTDFSKGILLSDLSANFQQLLDKGQLFRGHPKFHGVYQAHQ